VRHRAIARPSLPDDPDYARRWTIVDTDNKGRYTEYQKMTDRTIPIVELRPKS
jgi:F420H(2)-dependent quinone reductase